MLKFYLLFFVIRSRQHLLEVETMILGVALLERTWQSQYHWLWSKSLLESVSDVVFARLSLATEEQHYSGIVSHGVKTETNQQQVLVMLACWWYSTVLLYAGQYWWHLKYGLVVVIWWLYLASDKLLRKMSLEGNVHLKIIFINLSNIYS